MTPRVDYLALLDATGEKDAGSPPPGARILPFDPDRRRRTVARLVGFPCPSCGSADGWVVNPRGDAHCRPCEARRRSEEART